jgi:hypothetical protein
MRKAALIVMLTIAPWACAQRLSSSAPAHSGAPAHHAAPVSNGARGNFARANFAQRHQADPRSRSPRTSPFGANLLPLFSDLLSPEDLYAAGYPIASQLPFMVQGAAPAGASDFSDRQPQSPHESLLLELQGNRYVRVNNNQTENGVEQLTASSSPDVQPVTPLKNSGRAASHDSTPPQTPLQASTPLPPVTLVLRDGTRQQVRDYTIADGVLYARGDFYTDGYWNKTIQLSALNVPETLSANNTQGVKFILPSAPNEVITRP